MAWIATAIIGGSLIGAGASYFGARSAGNAASDAANAQSDAQVQSTQMQLDYLREVDASIADAVDRGLIDLETGVNMAIEQLQPMAGYEQYNAARGLLENPESVMDRPGIQFQYNQGLSSLQSMLSRSSGGGVSGQGMVAATEYGQNFASNSLDAELNRLFPFINIANEANTNIANLYSGLGTSQANLRVGGATGAANVTGSMIPSIAQGVSNMGNISAANSINQANITSGLYSGMGNSANSLAMLFAMNPKMFGVDTPGLFSGG